MAGGTTNARIQFSVNNSPTYYILREEFDFTNPANPPTITTSAGELASSAHSGQWTTDYIQLGFRLRFIRHGNQIFLLGDGAMGGFYKKSYSYRGYISVSSGPLTFTFSSFSGPNYYTAGTGKITAVVDRIV